MVRMERERDRVRRWRELVLGLLLVDLLDTEVPSSGMRRHDNSSIALRAIFASMLLRLMYTWMHPAASAASAIILGGACSFVHLSPRWCGNVCHFSRRKIIQIKVQIRGVG